MTPFVYDLRFKDTDKTKDRLIKATQYLLSSYGYEATTTRMIANTAKVNLSAINFHFENKENLVRAAVEAAAEKLSEYYKKLSNEIQEFLAEPVIDKDRAWGYIDRFLSQRVQRTFDGKKSYINVGLVSHENGFPESSQNMMSVVAIRDNELILADLIYYVMDHKDRFQAVLLARSVTAAIMTYMEKPILNRELGKEAGIDLEDLDEVQDCMHSLFMKWIEAVAVVDPMKKQV